MNKIPFNNAELEQLKKNRDSLQGRLNNLVGKFAEFQLFTDFRTRQHFPLSIYFDGVKDNTRLNIAEVRMRDKFQRGGWQRDGNRCSR